MATNLFAPLSEQTKKDVLVEFRAGLMNKDSNSKWVRPDKRKGLVQLKLVESLLHFTWKDRTTGTTAIDLMLFPEDATFRKVSEAKARVFVLEFKTSDKKLFFWMQEPKDEKDAQNCENINKYINNPPQPGQSSGPNGLAGLGAAAGLDIGGLDQNNFLQQLLRSAGGAGLGGLGIPGAGRGRGSSSSGGAAQSATPATSGAPRPAATPPTPSPAPATGSSQSAVNRQTLENLLAGFAQLPQQPKGPSLSDVVDADKLISSGLFDNQAVVDKLAEFLPEGPVTAANLKENLRSPQFQQAVSTFNQALRSGQMSAIMSSFGLDATSVGPNSTIEDFLLAIQKKAKEEKTDMDTSQ